MSSQQSNRSATCAVSAGFFLDMEQYFKQIPHDLALCSTTSRDNGEIAFNDLRLCGSFTVVFSGKFLHLSKAILSINSKYFHSSFTNDFPYPKHSAHSTLDLSNDDNPAALEAMFRCMYTHKASSLYSVADPDADSTSSCYLKRLSIIIAIFLVADEYDTETVREVCLHQFSAEYRAAKEAPTAQNIEDFIAAVRFLCESADIECIADKSLHMLFVHICTVDNVVIGCRATYRDLLGDFSFLPTQIVEEHRILDSRSSAYPDGATSARWNVMTYPGPRPYCLKCGNYHY
ncbi:hypothetical protein BDV97DRAFT_360443 [Delphinella strobiligena]|nr:hypothetical protein BDV97DRAFT_360443 [Delphinella strobiligena]